MAHALYRVINRPVKWLLRSPLHGLLSSNTLLLEFTGRKSGRSLSTPISYHSKDGSLHCFTSRDFGWWRNLRNGETVTVIVKGKREHRVARLEADDPERIARALHEFLIAVPRDARHSGVRLGKGGVPDGADIRKAAPGMVYLSFAPES